jgi:hypothetical protein
MTENFLSEMTKRKFLAPSKESLLEKIMGLEEAMARYEKNGLDENQKQILHSCRDYLQRAKECMRGFRSHPHLIWNLLHRIDENFIFLMPQDELYARAIDTRTTFDLTITEKKVREEILGEKGKLTAAIKDLKEDGQHLEKDQYFIRDALQYLNEYVDTNYWILSMNILTCVWSAVFLGTSLLVYFFVYSAREMIPYAFLGFMGAFLSNLLTKENFLFVRGGPFGRYLLYNLMARPILGAFAATFILWIEKTKWIFSINHLGPGEKTSPAVQSSVININVPEIAYPYVLMVIAIVSGFAAEKLLRSMIDRVLKRLEEKAEKTKEAKTEKKKTDESS